MKRFLVDSLSAVTRVVFHERVWSVIFALQDRFVTPHLERARGRASLWHVRGVPATVRVHGPIKVIGPERLVIGEHVRIGRGCFLHCLGGLTIGDNAQLSRDIIIYTASHDYEGDAIPYDTRYVEKPVTIGRSVWIGMNVCIVPGVTIGDGAIIGLGTIVSKDVPAGAVVVGGAQREVRTRDLDRFRRLDGEKRWFGRLWPDH